MKQWTTIEMANRAPVRVKPATEMHAATATDEALEKEAWMKQS